MDRFEQAIVTVAMYMWKLSRCDDKSKKDSLKCCTSGKFNKKSFDQFAKKEGETLSKKSSKKLRQKRKSSEKIARSRSFYDSEISDDTKQNEEIDENVLDKKLSKKERKQKATENTDEKLTETKSLNDNSNNRETTINEFCVNFKGINAQTGLIIALLVFFAIALSFGIYNCGVKESNNNNWDDSEDSSLYDDDTSYRCRRRDLLPFDEEPYVSAPPKDS